MFTTAKYISKRRYGRLGKPGIDDSDSEDDIHDPDLIDKTPNTRRHIKEEKIKKSIPKLNRLMTFMSLFKGFIISSPIFTPKSFVNAGYIMSTIMFIVSGMFTGYCATLLIDLRKKTDITNYSRIGKAAYGPWGKFLVDSSLWLT